jgi:hypothetical protein
MGLVGMRVLSYYWVTVVNREGATKGAFMLDFVLGLMECWKEAGPSKWLALVSASALGGWAIITVHKALHR